MKLRIDTQSKKYFCLLLFALPFLLYWNSIDNEYAIDDNLVVDGVEKIQDGVSAIPEIFTSHYSTDKTQSFGYRPIASSSFAVEKEFLGHLPEKQAESEKQTDNRITQANINHLVNILLYAFTGILLFYFLQQIFPENNFLLPFVITLFFILMPIHSEPVNNIKSRDTLLEMLGILGSLVFYVRYSKKGNLLHLLLAMACMLLAVYSKKSAVALLGIAPAVLYYTEANYKKIGIAFLSAFLVVVIAVLVKKGLLAQPAVRIVEYHENPLISEGNFFDRLAMGFYTSFLYLKLMVFPKEFSFYYGYSKIPLANWGFYQVWLGVLVFVPLAIYGLKRFIKKDALGLGIVLWLGVMLGVVNVLFPIVGIVGERFSYVFSMGFSILVGVLLVRLFKLETRAGYREVKIPRFFMAAILFIALAYSIKTLSRNDDWENYIVLYRNDIEHLQHSAKANVMLGDLLLSKVIGPESDANLSAYLKKKNLDEAIGYYKNALAVVPTYNAALNNLAISNMYLGKYRESIGLFKKMKLTNKNEQELMFNLGFAYFQIGEYSKAIPFHIKSIKMTPEKMILYNNLFLMAKDEAFRPKIEQELQKISSGLENKSPSFNIYLGNYFYTNKEYKKALGYYQRGLKLEPANKKLAEFVKNSPYFK